MDQVKKDLIKMFANTTHEKDINIIFEKCPDYMVGMAYREYKLLQQKYTQSVEALGNALVLLTTHDKSIFKMPEEVEKDITQEFLAMMKDDLIEVFGESYDRRGVRSSYGWNKVFRRTCDRFGLDRLKYLHALCGDYEGFDEIIAKKMREVGKK